MDQDEGERVQWLVKGIPLDTRQRALAAAERRGEKMATWLNRAALAQVDLEEDDRLFPPEKLNGAPAELAELAGPAPVAAAAKVAVAALDVLGRAKMAGLTVPQRVERHAWALLGRALRQARAAGTAPAPKRLAGPTIEGGGNGG